MKVVELDVPVMSEIGELRSVELRAPTASDIIDLGMPYHVARTPDGFSLIIQDETVLERYIARLTSTAPACIRDLSMTDLLVLNHAVMMFFVEAGETSLDSKPSTITAERERLSRKRQVEAFAEMKLGTMTPH